MAAYISKHALSFMASSARLALKHGLKKGFAQGASKLNPALLVIEAVASVAGAVDSYLSLSRAKEYRSGLQKLIPLEEERLRREREQLAQQLKLAREELAQKKDVQRVLGKLVLVCATVNKTAMTELEAIRASELPDLENFERLSDVMESSWLELQQALENYNKSYT